jgi:hypothetical protein
MSELAVRQALKDLISNNKSTLVTGLYNQGASRSIKQITYSSLTPPQQYYFISIIVEEVSTTARFTSNAAVPPSQALYNVAIEMSDYAIATPGENQLYEKMDADFQLLSDRLVALLREQYWITDAVTNSKFRLINTREVNKNNLSSIWSDAAAYHALLYCRITFQVIEECTSDEVLY